MDKHEKGIDVDPYRPDQPLPRWNGSYKGDAKNLPKVVQKLLLKRTLTAEEKAELLWRFFELQEGGRMRERLLWLLSLLLCIACFAGYLAYNHQLPFLAALAHPK